MPRARLNGWRRTLAPSCALVLLVTAGLWTVLWPGLLARRETAAWQVLVDHSRAPAFFGRPAGGFSSSSLKTEATGEPRVPSGQVRAAAAWLILSAQRDPSAARRRRSAIAQFVLGREREATAILESIVAAAPMDAASHNDLAVLTATRALTRNAWTDVVRALAAVERARRVDPRLREASFTRALLLETIGLPQQAIAAWREFVDREPSSGWRHEAMQRLAVAMRNSIDVRPIEDVLSSRRDANAMSATVQARVLAARDYLIETLLAHGEAGAGRERGVTGAMQHEARNIAAEIDALTGDRFASNIVRTWSSKRDDAALVGAHEKYGKAMRLWGADQVSAALRELGMALDSFRAVDSPMSLLVRVRLVSSAAGRMSASEIDRELDDIEREASVHAYAGVLGLVYWKRGLWRVNNGKLEDACLEYAKAIEAFTRAHETENVANVHSLLAETYRLLGELDQAGFHHAAALKMSAMVWNPRIRHQILSQAAITSLALGQADAALAFQEALLANAQMWGVDGAQGIAFLQRARAVAALGRPDRAVDDLRQAAVHVARIPDPEFRGRFDTELRLAEAEVLEQNPARAMAAASGAVDALRARRVARLPQALFTRGRLLERLGDTAGAERDFLDSAALMEQQRASLRDQPLQLSLLEQNTGTYRALAHLASNVKGRPIDGLQHVEHMRARGLLDALSVDPDPVLSPLEVSHAHADVTFLCYAFRGDDLMIWALRDTVVEYRLVRAVRGPLRQAMGEMPRALTDVSIEQMNDVLRKISGLILEPVADFIDRANTIVVLPDEDLYAVPFAALSVTRRPGVIAERHAIVTAPSFSVYGREGKQSSEPVSASNDVLVVAPAVAGMTVLPNAKRESSDVAAVYPTSTALVGDAATPARFLAAVQEHTVVHFAGHGVANEEQPAFSRLLLVSAPGMTGGLLASEIAKQRFRRTRLVVLGACEGARGAIRSGEGVLSIGRAFLVAGVPAVVGALWQVDDEMTRRLMTRFHQAAAQGVAPAAALRDAQRAMLADADPRARHPMAWAGFVVMEAGGGWSGLDPTRRVSHGRH